MPTSSPKDSTSGRYIPIAAAVGGSVLALGIVLAWYLWPPPQMGADREVFDTVDALFTAVTAKSEPKLADCERRLHAYSESGKLPPSASVHLDGIIKKARGGAWDAAAKSLYTFMREQRRDGAAEPRSKKSGKSKTNQAVSP